MNAPEPGTVLGGKYLVEQVLGSGGMGIVVAARHLHLDQRVAIKFLLPDALKNPEVVERFSREARSAAKIRGEHVARVVDVGHFDDGAPFMVMEYLEGNDLARQLELFGPLPIEDAVRYILETCEALAEAHSARIVHRDLKPSNLFLAARPDKRSIIKVLDFGISKVEGAPSAALTKTTALMGTAFYMSPEQMTAPKTVDHRSDIWALGVILYELLAGTPPFLGESVPEIIAGILQNDPAPLSSLRPDVPPGVEAVIARCMRTKVSERFANVAALAAALAPFAAQADRRSVEITARVLGESVLPPSARVSESGGIAKMTLVMTPQPSSSGAQPVAEAPKRTRTTELGASATEPAPPMPGVTTHGLTTSSISQSPAKRPIAALVAAAVAAVAVGSGAGIFFMTRGHDGAKASAGLVAAPVSAPTVRSTAPSESPPIAAAAPVASLAPAPTAQTPTASPSELPSAAPPPEARAPRAPVVVASAPTPRVATSPPSKPLPASTASKNPLQMGLK